MSLSSKLVRLTVDLPPQTIDELHTLAASRKISLTEALQQAIANQGFLDIRARNGALLMLK